jgi:hypothetical protein
MKGSFLVFKSVMNWRENCMEAKEINLETAKGF